MSKSYDSTESSTLILFILRKQKYNSPYLWSSADQNSVHTDYNTGFTHLHNVYTLKIRRSNGMWKHENVNEKLVCVSEIHAGIILFCLVNVVSVTCVQADCIKSFGKILMSKG